MTGHISELRESSAGSVAHWPEQNRLKEGPCGNCSHQVDGRHGHFIRLDTIDINESIRLNSYISVGLRTRFQKTIRIGNNCARFRCSGGLMYTCGFCLPNE